MFLCRLFRKTVVLVTVVVVLLIIASVLLILHFVHNSSSNDNFPFGIGIYTYEVVLKYSHIHDPAVGKQLNVGSNVIPINRAHSPFTQGLFFIDNDTLMESSGLYGASYIREFSLSSGETKRFSNLKSNLFAEGLAIVVEPMTYKKFILTLTYKEKIILVFDYDTMELYHTFEHELDGYGLTSNIDLLQSVDDLKEENFARHQKLWTTTGDNYLYEIEIPHEFLKTKKLSISGKTEITCAGYSIYHVNELEYHVQAKTLYANIFLTKLILEIDISKGTCLKIINLSGLVEQCDNYQEGKKNQESVLNGIAIDPHNNKVDLPNLLVTGKLWPNMFQIRLVKSIGKLEAATVLSEYFKSIGKKVS
ncbi:Glutamine cyclotransferase [Plasmodium cynomolgi strain B]|uniref:Glutamine cyclotransferase n=1 Tax=Plasmodium cynomolgi (strain B) TaxID=1120755 RepID=K6VFP1_PLACD|nr:Glutamine cyclotransferase [Plasmodium cynomolgi strain B]GAB68117.1 Glutamine cyclotransferase [Plasmodium cynomolgi strain B]